MNITPNLGINTNHYFLINTEYLDYPSDKTTIKYSNYPSITVVNAGFSFPFQHVLKEKITRMINMLDFKSYTFNRYSN